MSGWEIIARDIIGVELEEIFVIEDHSNYECMVKTDGVYGRSCSGRPWVRVYSDVLIPLIGGDVKAIKKPFIPKLKERFFVITKTGGIQEDTYEQSTYDCALIAMGNAFRTKTEAEKSKQKIIEIFKEKGVYYGK